jgi:hypothetical protein
MNVESLSQTIKIAIEKYDNICEKNNKYIKNRNISILNDKNQIKFIFDNYTEDFDCELLGYFDNQNNIWIYSWVLTNIESSLTKTSKELLEYGLKLEPDTNTDEHFMIKSLLVNSRIQIEESIQLDINLALYTSLLKDKIKFIYPKISYIDESHKNFITFYYLIK